MVATGVGFARVTTGFGFLATAGAFTARLGCCVAETGLFDGFVTDFFDDFLTVFFATVFFATDFFEAFLTVFFAVFFAVFLTAFLTVFLAFFAAGLPVLPGFFLARFFDAALARCGFAILLAFRFLEVFCVDFATTNSFMT